jgi:hypothetical protein
MVKPCLTADDLNQFVFVEISGRITILEPTGGIGESNYTTTVLDFSSQVPRDINIRFHILRLGFYALPFHDHTKTTFVRDADYANRNLTIISNSGTWNNYPYYILLIYKR